MFYFVEYIYAFGEFKTRSMGMKVGLSTTDRLSSSRTSHDTVRGHGLVSCRIVRKSEGSRPGFSNSL